MDLLVSMYHDHEIRKQTDPDATVEEEQQDTNLTAAYAALEKDAKSGKIQEQIQAYLRSKASDTAPRRVVSIQSGVIVGRE